MNTQYILYSTSNCHLCEEAESLLKQANLKWLTIEIAYSDELLSLYGLKIPVIRHVMTNLELSWPFSLLDIQNLSNQTIL